MAAALSISHSLCRGEALYALDLELPSKLGLRSFHGTRGAIRGNSRPGPLTQSLPNPPGSRKKRGVGEGVGVWDASRPFFLFMTAGRMYRG